MEIDATNDQQEKLRAIVKSAVKDLLPMRDQASRCPPACPRLPPARPVRPSTAPRSRSFRAEQITKVDAFSKRVTQALTDAADVLTPAPARPDPRTAGVSPGWLAAVDARVR